MMNSPDESNGNERQTRHDKDYEDPQYHDEELDPVGDDGGQRRWPLKRKPSRWRLPKRHYE